MFPPHNRGKQSVAISYAVLAYAKRFALSKFSGTTVNDVLKYGDRIYSATRRIRHEELKRNKELPLSDLEIEHVLDGQSYGVEDIVRAFCIGPDQVQVHVTPEVVVGDINAQNSEEVMDVKRALESYFEEHRSGILSCKNLTVAVWRGARVYFMFDSNSRGPNGVECVNGEACVTRYLDVGTMADVFLQNLIKDGRNAFAIHQVKVHIGPCPREPKPEEKARPEGPFYSGFGTVMPGKRILRGNISQEDPRFGRGKNVQSLPIAVMALTVSLLHKPQSWTKPIIDDVLVLGDELYVATLDTLGFEYNPWEQSMTVHLVNKDYKVGTLRANCQLRSTDQRGIIDIKHPKIINIRLGMACIFFSLLIH